MSHSRTLSILFLSLSFAAFLYAQTSRVAQIDNGRRVLLRGHVPARAAAGTDQGAVDAAFPLPEVTLMLQPSASQQTELADLLARQQDPSSPDYHHWLTPEEYAARFGVSQEDIDKITVWMAGQNFQVARVARARNAIVFTGSAMAVRNAFRTEIHHYLVDGMVHFANASEPSIPAALQGVVVGIRGLHDFRMSPRARVLQPAYNTSSGVNYLAPDDFAVIYNYKPLLSSGITGAGQKLVVVGQSNIRLDDIRKFRAFFNLPVNDPEMVLVPSSIDPGLVRGDELEADLDLEWAGAIAREATVIFVYSPDVVTSLQYAIDQNLAPTLSMSYGQCEAITAPTDATFFQSLAQQANAQGVTWFAASGDAGAADCAGSGVSTRVENQLSVDLPASLPEVTGVGGTKFNEAGGSYWNAANDANHASALSYIPEVAWNDSSTGQPAATGGGSSVYFPKPSWQTGTGVPSDNARNVPDISLPGSGDHDAYAVFNVGSLQPVGGTSAGAPTGAGTIALLNEYLVAINAQSAAGVGNINPRLYSLAQTSPATFHDITAGDNIVTVCSGRVCSSPIGFPTTPGYDRVTGLGSFDANSLVTAWPGPGSHALPGPPHIDGVTNGASYQTAFAPGMIISIFGSGLAPASQPYRSVPLPSSVAGVTVTIGGIAAPLYYVSSTQINVQIPNETPVNATAELTVNNNGQKASFSLPVAAAAPGIFTDQNHAPVPNKSGARGQTITLYITGYGLVTPDVHSGYGPNPGDLPMPVQPVEVTVGGMEATSVVAVPQGYVGVAQVNYTVPATAPLGPQPVVVSVGGILSAPATLNVTQ